LFSVRERYLPGEKGAGGVWPISKNELIPLLIAILLMVSFFCGVDFLLGADGLESMQYGIKCIEMGNPLHLVSDDHFTYDPAKRGYAVTSAEERFALLYAKRPNKKVAATVVFSAPISGDELVACELGEVQKLYFITSDSDETQALWVTEDSVEATLRAQDGSPGVFAADVRCTVTHLAEVSALDFVHMVDPHWIENPIVYRKTVGVLPFYKGNPEQVWKKERS